METTTRERMRHAGESYLPPVTDQTHKREYGRIAAWHETLERKGAITPDQAMAAREVDTYWHAVNDPVSVTCAYGDQRWNGTPVGQLDLPALFGPEWRETCRNRLKAARNVLVDEEWHSISTAIERNAGLIEIGRTLGYTSERTCRHRVGKSMRSGLQALAILWRIARPYHDPMNG